MFCSNCGSLLKESFKFCTKCGNPSGQNSDARPCTLEPIDSDGRAGSSTRPTPGTVTSDEAIPTFNTFMQKKKEERMSHFKKKTKKRTNEKEEPPVTINVGIMRYVEEESSFKPQRGKSLPLKLRKTAENEEILKLAVAKHAMHNGNEILHSLPSGYKLLYPDGTEVQKLKESDQAFTLQGYKSELGKPYNRITFYLCTTSDFLDHSLKGCVYTDSDNDNETEKDFEEPSEPTQSKISKFTHRLFTQEDEEAQNKEQEQSDAVLDIPVFSTSDQMPGPSINHLATSDAKDTQIKNDEQVARSLQEEFNRESDNEPSQFYSTIDDQAGVLKALEEKVIREKDSLFLVVRRGAPLDRVLYLWRRESRKVSPENELRIKFLGEDGIDSGALTKEFLTLTVTDIGKKLFPNGSPVHSTNDVHNGNFKACGEIVATSLAQGGPPPCFLAECVYNTLVLESDIDFTSVSPEQHLTSTEQELLHQIQRNVIDYQDAIIEHGYTGVINEANVDSITAAIVVSMLSRRTLCLKEFKKGLQCYGLSGVISRYPHLTRGLFVMGQQQKVDANYLLSLMTPELSPEGSSRRQKEDEIMDHFQDFLISLDDEVITGYTEAIAFDMGNDLNVVNVDQCTPDDQEMATFSTPDLTPAGVLGWLTGQKHREIRKTDLGITVKFDHECLMRNPEHRLCFPSVGACGRTITFPVSHMGGFDQFKEIFLLAFCKGQTFAMS